MMPALIPVLIGALPSIISGLLSAIESIKKITSALKDNSASLTPEQLQTLEALDAKLTAGLKDVAGVTVRP